MGVSGPTDVIASSTIKMLKKINVDKYLLANPYKIARTNNVIYRFM